MGDIQEYWATPQNGWSHHLKYHFQLKANKDIEDGDSVAGGHQEKHTK